MGAVYEAIHTEIGKQVAIKTLAPALAALPDAHARFLQEAQLTSRIRHPHIVDVTDVGAAGGATFLVMEYLEGEDLATYIDRCGALPVSDAVDIALPVIAAVAAAHEEGIVHRDLKASNIFLTRMRDGAVHPKVLDFGISKAISEMEPPSLRTTGGRLLGSPTYLAPEQVQDPGSASAASDQYALGLMLYECVTGRLPFDSPNLQRIFEQILSGGYPPAGAHRPDLPVGVQRIIATAMNIDPADRFADVEELGRELLPYASAAARLVWARSFGEAPPAVLAPLARPAVSPMPVTAQTPAPIRPPFSVTAPIPGTERLRPLGSAPQPEPVFVPVPELAPVPVSVSGPDAPARVPRSAAPWAVVGLVATAAVALTLIALRSGDKQSPPAQPQAIVQAPLPPPRPRAAPEPAPAPAAPAPAVAQQPAPQPDQAPRPAPRRMRERPAARYGPNGASLID
jgi:serine/threonine-protein kinase